MGIILCLVGMVIMGASVLFAIGTKGNKPIVTHLFALIGQVLCVVGLILYF